MKEIEITQRVRRMIRAADKINFRDTGRPSIDPGYWLVKVDKEVYDAITAQAHEGEEFSDTLERLFATKVGRVN